MRLRHHLPAIFLVLVTLASQLPAQKEHAKWYFGFKAGLDFLNDPPTILNNSAMSAVSACANVADQSGNLLCYTQGTIIWNNSHLPMANGTGLLGIGGGLHRILFEKLPGSNNIYYLFTTGITQPFRYSVIDMSLAAGQGSVTLKNISVTTATLLSKICGAYHCNGEDSWIVTQEKDNGAFHCFLLTGAGLNTTAVISTVGASYRGLGGMKISPSANKLAVCGSETSSNYIVQLFNFNSTTGVVSNPLTLYQGTLNVQSLEFSPDASKLYVIAEEGPTLLQWDLCAGDSASIVSSKTLIPSSQYEGALQLNENGRIYLAQNGAYQLGVVIDPNLYGASCNFSSAGPSTGTNQIGAGLPNYFLRHKNQLDSFSYMVNPSLGCHALSFTSAPEPTVSCAASNYSVIGTSWIFGDPSSGAANTSQLKNPVHYYPASGPYTVKQIFHYPCGSDTITQEVTVPPPHLLMASSPGCGSSGAATVSVQGGIGPFTFTWFPSQKSGSVAAGLSTGLHTVAVFDQGLACTASGTVAVTNATLPVIQILPSTLVAVCQDKNAVVGISAVADSYTIIPSAGVSGIGSGTISILSPGPLLYTITANSGSCSSTSSFSLSLAPSPHASIQLTKTTACAQGTVLLTGSGGSDYSWMLPDNKFASGAVITATLPVAPGPAFFYLTVRNQFGCETQTVDTVDVVAIPSGMLPDFAHRACAPHCATYSFVPSNNNSAIKTEWQLQGINYQEPLRFCLKTPGTYTLTGRLSDTLTGCSATTFSRIEVFTKPRADFSFEPQITELFTEVLFISEYRGLPDENHWFFSVDNTTYTFTGSDAGFIFPDAGIYPVVLLVQDHNGCTDTITKPIVVHPPEVFYVPDAFTPNHDGRNETFRPVVGNVKNYHLSIYNRWGQKIFETNDPAQGWNGTWQDSDCKPDTYVWLLDFRDDSGLQKKAGRIMLLR